MQGSMDIDSSRMHLYSTDQNSIQLYKYSPENNEENISDLSYVNNIPIVKTYNGEVIKPDNLLLHQGGKHILLSDANSYKSILNLDIERGIITNKKHIHTTIGYRDPEDINIKVNKFDYNSHSDTSKFDKYVVGINSNHVIRFDVTSGDIVNKKAYEKNPHFNSITTDYTGNTIIGDAEGKIRVYPDIEKKAVKCTAGLGNKITDIKVSSTGDILATTEDYFIYYQDFVEKENSTQFIGKINPEVIKYLDLNNHKMKNSQFSKDEKTIITSIGKYLFYWNINKLIAEEQEYIIYEADKPIISHKFVDGQFILMDKPVKIAL